MTRILISETALQRIGPRLGPLAAQLECVVMAPDGTLRFNGQEISPDDAKPDCTWLSSDTFFSVISADYFGLIKKATTLKWAQSAGAGIDSPIFAILAGKNIRVTTNHGQAIGMSEYIMWGVLNHFQNGAAHAAEQAAHRWTKQRSREVSGSRWLIVGFGAIGEAVAHRAKGFDAHVTGVRRKPAQSPFADVMITPDQLPDHLGNSDVVVFCMPHTAQTANMVDADFLAAMKPGSILINVGRGTLIDDDALIAALDTGRPEYALLDVFRVEPLPAEHPFWDHPRITVTAHTSASSTGVEERSDNLFLDNLGRYIKGETLLNEVPVA